MAIRDSDYIPRLKIRDRISGDGLLGTMKNFITKYDSLKYYYLLLIPLALLMFPHQGIIHDTRLYVFDILNIAHDGIFSNDILTSVGTQDKYTLYSYIASPLYEILSPWAATTVVFIVGQLVWFSGLIALVVKFAGDRKIAVFGLISVFLLPAAYFGFSVLSYGESFATPRLFVEGQTFWSLWCFFTRRYFLTVLLVVVALALHPIMGLITAALLIAILLQEDRRWWWIFGVASAVGAAFALGSGLVPVERLSAVMDGDWLHVVQARAKYLYLAEWRARDWARIIVAVSITMSLLALYSGWQRRLVIGALIVGLSGLVVSFIGTDLLHNVLLSQVQTSRAIWFAYLLGNVGLGLVVANMYRKSEADGDVFFFLFISVWIIAHILWPITGIIIGLLTSGLAYLRFADKIAGIPSLFRRLIYMLTAFLFFWTVVFRVKFWLLPGSFEAVFADGGAYVGLKGFSQIEVAVIVFVVFAVVRLRLKVPAYVTTALLILLAVWSIFVWDRRSADNRGLEGAYLADSLLEHIPEGAQVYWEGNTKGAWLLLGRPSYFADAQGAGVVFSEDLAVEYLKRAQIIQAIDGVEYVDIWRPFGTNDEYQERLKVQKSLRRSELVDVCLSASELDFLALTRQIEGAYMVEWVRRTADQNTNDLPAEADSQSEVRLYLYRCADFR